MAYDFFRTFFHNRLWFRLFYWAVSRHTRNTKGKSPGPMRVRTKVGEVDWREVGLPGLPPRFGSSWDDWLQRCKDLVRLRREGRLRRGSWLHVSGWRSSVQCKQLRRFVGGWRVSGGLWLVLSYWWRRRPRSTCPQLWLQAPPSGSVGWSKFVRSTHAMSFFFRPFESPRS